MYSDFVLIDSDNTESTRIERLAFGDTFSRNEAWLRDTLYRHEGLLPVRDIDAAFGPLIPLCCELRTEAGLVDVVFINDHGRLTLVECKLWRNPESRRKVVAQVLDYARALSRWTYADLQREVARATGEHGNVPFEIVRKRRPEIQEQQFIDQVARGLRNARFLLVIAGDGIREDVSAIAELINRNAALGFSFALVEVALYGMPKGGLLVQPRVVARTREIERFVVEVRDRSDVEVVTEEGHDDATSPATETKISTKSPKGDWDTKYGSFWGPVMARPLDDPDQSLPIIAGPNSVKANLPWKGTWILCYWQGEKVGVSISGRTEAFEELVSKLDPYKEQILEDLPESTTYGQLESGGGTYSCERVRKEFADDDKCREWIAQTLNAFVNVFRPLIRRVLRED